ncbi:hypothetical protein KW805_02225 [Candidatus Pacearchaeota archaeon]|nr:hypothetical protein [Candidatus Pacearchaeota archaeon]
METTIKDKKGRFLSMDLIDRLIRVEQKVAATFHTYLTYRDTEYFKSLTLQEKKEFESYLKTKKKKTFLFPIGMVFALFLLSLFNLTFTGKAVAPLNTSPFSASMVSIGIAFITVVVIVAIYHRRWRNKRLEHHTKIIETVLQRPKHSL